VTPGALPRAGAWSTPTYSNIFSQSITNEHFAAPAMADFEKNGRQLVAAGLPDGQLRFVDPTNGVLAWSFYTGAGAIHASPTVVDFNKDGYLDVVTANTRGDVWVVSPKLRKPIWHMVTGDGDPRHPPGNFGTPAVVDLNKDGVLDVVETSWDHHLYAWSGSWDPARSRFPLLPGFPVFLKDTSWSSPSIADIDRDGWQEIVFGYDCDGVAGQDCAGHPGGYVGVLRHDGHWQPGWPRFVSGQVIWSTPAISDLDGDGWLDIVVGTGNMPAPHMPDGHQLLAFNRNGGNLPGFPMSLPARTTSSPAIGDVNGDGKKEIALVGEDGKLYVVDRTGHALWARCVSSSLVCPVGLHTSPTIGDVDGDGKQEIVVGGEQWLDVFSGNGQMKYRGWPGPASFGTHAISGAPLITTLNGKTAIIATTDRNVGSGRAGAIFVYTLPHAPGVLAWPAFKHDQARTGLG
jgi:hypothetical protein